MMTAAPPVSPEALPESTLPWKVLVAEDNEGDLHLLYEALSDCGASAQLTAVKSLSDAVSQARSGQFELLLLDLGLPDSSGLEALRTVLREAPEIPVVVITGLDDENIAKQAVREGAQDYLIKGEWIRQGGYRALLRSLQYAVGRQRTLTALRATARNRMMFLASASHELRTPITIIRDYAWLLSDGTSGPLEPAQLECVEAILRNCVRLTALVEDLLDTSKLESGNLPLRIEYTQPFVLLRHCYDDFEHICRSKNQSLELQMDEDIGPILCDRQRMTQVILNLLTNASRFTPEGGSIVLRGFMGDDGLEIEVQDSGVGISPEHQRTIFDAFVQVDRRTGPGPQGTGLGLYIARRIVAMHGGTIGVVSQPGQGSVFSIRIPAAAQGADLTALRACLTACAGPGTAADLTAARPYRDLVAPIATGQRVGRPTPSGAPPRGSHGELPVQATRFCVLQ